MQFKCNQCSFQYQGINRSKLNYHHETEHVMEIQLQIEEKNKTIKIKRNNGEFKCICGKSSKIPRTMYHHKKCFFRDEVMMEMIEEEMVNNAMLANNNEIAGTIVQDNDIIVTNTATIAATSTATNTATNTATATAAATST